MELKHFEKTAEVRDSYLLTLKAQESFNNKKLSNEVKKEFIKNLYDDLAQIETVCDINGDSLKLIKSKIVSTFFGVDFETNNLIIDILEKLDFANFRKIITKYHTNEIYGNFDTDLSKMFDTTTDDKIIFRITNCVIIDEHKALAVASDNKQLALLRITEKDFENHKGKIYYSLAVNEVEAKPYNWRKVIKDEVNYKITLNIDTIKELSVKSDFYKSKYSLPYYSSKPIFLNLDGNIKVVNSELLINYFNLLNNGKSKKEQIKEATFYINGLTMYENYIAVTDNLFWFGMGMKDIEKKDLDKIDESDITDIYNFMPKFEGINDDEKNLVKNKIQSFREI